MNYPLLDTGNNFLDDPTPLARIDQENEDDPCPIIPNANTVLADAMPIIHSPGYSVDQHPNPTSHSSGNQQYGSSVMEAESEKTSMVVLAQSMAGSVNAEDRGRFGNGKCALLCSWVDLGSRLNSPIMTGQAVDSISLRRI